MAECKFCGAPVNIGGICEYCGQRAEIYYYPMKITSPLQTKKFKNQERKRDGEIYTVKSGDNLWNIAKRFYGDGIYYKNIAYSNQIKNPDQIYPGQILYMPQTRRM